MRILFDQGTPAPLKKHLSAHQVQTAFELGWSRLTNGDLLAAAGEKFDIFVTTDQNLQYQQSLAGANWQYWCCLQQVGPDYGSALTKSSRH